MQKLIHEELSLALLLPQLAQLFSGLCALFLCKGFCQQRCQFFCVRISGGLCYRQQDVESLNFSFGSLKAENLCPRLG
jgi:hypothetical protein